MRKRLVTAFFMICSAHSAFAATAGHSGGSLLSSEMAFKAINFVILLILLHRFARKPIAKMLSNSAENTKNTTDSAKEELASAKARLAEYEIKIANMEKELASREEIALAAIEAEKVKLIADAKEQAQKLEEQAQNRIEQDILKAKTDIREFLVSESVQFAEKIITDEIGSKEHKALVENYVKYFNQSA